MTDADRLAQIRRTINGGWRIGITDQCWLLARYDAMEKRLNKYEETCQSCIDLRERLRAALRLLKGWEAISDTENIDGPIGCSYFLYDPDNQALT